MGDVGFRLRTTSSLSFTIMRSLPFDSAGAHGVTISSHCVLTNDAEKQWRTGNQKLRDRASSTVNSVIQELTCLETQVKYNRGDRDRGQVEDEEATIGSAQAGTLLDEGRVEAETSP